MKLKTRLFTDQPLSSNAVLTPSPEQTHYLQHVLRLKEGDMVALFNGKDGEWAAVLSSFKKNAATVTLQHLLRPQVSSPELQLIFAPLKKARTDLVIEKATELGATLIQTVFTRYTNAERVNIDRLQTIAVEAAEQCGRLTVPTIKPPEDLSKALSSWPSDHPLIVCAESGPTLPLISILQKLDSPSASFLIGPEGGWSPEELKDLSSKPFVHMASLGPLILRAETAALAALACWQAWTESQRPKSL